MQAFTSGRRSEMVPPMRRTSRSLIALIALIALTSGCGDGSGPTDGGIDTARDDVGAPDAGRLDGGPIDGGPVDGGPVDGGPVDGGVPDGGVLDASLCNGICEASDACPADCAVCVPGTMTDCYGGPAGTRDVGTCRGGAQTCAADGASFGACVGEVVPALEDCSTPGDEDCDGVTPACPGVTLDADRFGGLADENALAVDATDTRVVLGGAIRSPTDFGGGALVPMGGEDGFVAVFDASGGPVWSRRFGDGAAQRVEAVALLDDGGVIIGGQFAGAIDLGGGGLISAGATDLFVARFDATGGHLWSRRFGDSNAQGLGALATDGTNVVATGSFEGTLDFGGGALTSAGSSDVFLVALGLAAGGHQWSRRFGNTSAQRGLDVDVDASGGVYVVGDFAGTVDFGGGTLTSAGMTDAFLARFTAAGMLDWSRRFGDASGQSASSVAALSTGDLALAGAFAGAIDLGGGALTSAGGDDGFVASLTGAGAHRWSHAFGDPAAQRVTSVCAVLDGVAVTGAFAGSVDLGGGALTSAGGTDVFLGRYDGAGGHVFSRRYGDSSSQGGSEIAANASWLAVVGDFTGSADFGTGLLTSAGGSDAFLLRIAR